MCLAMGIPHPDYLLPMLTATQMHDWEIYSIAEPFGQPRSDYMAGVIAAANGNLWMSKDTSPMQPQDYIPGQEAPEPTAEEIMSATKAFVSGMSH